MLDSKLLRTELDETAAKLARRGFKLDVETIRTLEEQRKSIQVEVENLQSTRNSISKQIGQLMASGDKAGAEAVKQQIGTLGDDLDAKKLNWMRLWRNWMRSPKPCLTFQTMQCQTVKTTAKT